MNPLLVFLIAASLASAADQVAPPPVAIQALIRQAEDAVAMDPKALCHADDPLGTTETCFFGRSNEAINSKKFCNPFNPVKFCAEVANRCSHATNEIYCDSDALYKDIRYQDKVLRRKVFRKAASYFQALLKDQLLADLCCGPGNTGCKDHLKKTGLVVLTGLGPDDETGDYDPDTHMIEVSESLLLHQLDEQNIESILEHEFGHACQFSRDRALKSAIYNSCKPFNVTTMITRDNLEQTLGPQTKDCIVDSLEKAAKKFKGPMCMGSWMREAFADAIFLPRRKDITGWARSCFGKIGEFHAAGAYTHCLMNRWPLKNWFCPEGAPK